MIHPLLWSMVRHGLEFLKAVANGTLHILFERYDDPLGIKTAQVRVELEEPANNPVNHL